MTDDNQNAILGGLGYSKETLGAKQLRLYDTSVKEDIISLEKHGVQVNLGNKNFIWLDPSVATRAVSVKFSARAEDNIIALGNAAFSRAKVSFNGSRNVLLVEESTQKLGFNATLGGNQNLIQIGPDVSINSADLLASGYGARVIIGKGCMISYGVRVRTSDSHSIIDLENGAVINSPQSVAIDEDVWLAADVMVLKGVHIGRGSIIAARSVVTRDVPPCTLMAGTPARKVRSNVSWLRQEAPSSKSRSDLCLALSQFVGQTSRS